MGAQGPGKVVELFAGVGGFRLGLEGIPAVSELGLRGDRDHGADWRVVWSNQWEPGLKAQDASSCYVRRFGTDGHVCEDIAAYLDWAVDGNEEAISESSRVVVPRDVDLLVGGFPCQDYSVAKPLSQAAGIEGRKGVLWWEINRFLEHWRPRYVLLENVDRLLKSPADQRGRDFAVMLSCFLRLDYDVQWRVVNAADHGFPQRRRRVFLLAERSRKRRVLSEPEARTVLRDAGTLARALPLRSVGDLAAVRIDDDPFVVSESFGHGDRMSVWADAGVLRCGVAWTARTEPGVPRRRRTLGEVLVDEAEVPEEFIIPSSRVRDWEYLKGAKREPRTDKRTGHEYFYSEGGVAFPDPLDQPSRTILTGEGGTSASRFKHVVRMSDGRLRRLLPVELERLQGFPDGWTALREDGTAISDGRRAFFMGNALVVGVVRAIGRELAADRRTGSSTLGV